MRRIRKMSKAHIRVYYKKIDDDTPSFLDAGTMANAAHMEKRLIKEGYESHIEINM